jgi:hypothetical protein
MCMKIPKRVVCNLGDGYCECRQVQECSDAIREGGEG